MYGNIIFVAIIMAVIIYCVFVLKRESFTSELIKVTASTDKRSYLVRNMPDKDKAADALAIVRDRLIKITKYMGEKFPDDDRVKRLQKNYRPDNISEGLPDGKLTSYSINKGEKLVFCVRQRDESNQLVDLNTMTFVAIHELSHLMTSSIGHTKEFWKNMEFLLDAVIDSGLSIYTYIPYHKQPQEYCGTTITDTPLKK